VKMAENLFVLSGGRFCLGLGAGWDHQEFESLKLPFGSASERSNCLEKVLHVCSTGWLRSCDGTSATDGSAAEDVRPFLLVGGEGEKRTLPAAVAYADVTNWQVGVAEFRQKSRVLRDLCEEAGRDPDSLGRTHCPNFQLFDSEREFALWRQHEDRGMSSDEVDTYIRRRGALYGTASVIEETIEEFVDAGCRGFMVFCNAAPSMQGLEHLASLPSVRRAIGHPDIGTHV
jgi:alkanesulfonate monooxygenase SsuD/methylene tetrahydromethanopterin reductase-like flavin-dependent oxidoreductase (luciferase family)